MADLLSDLNSVVNQTEKATQAIGGGVTNVAQTVQGVRDFFNGVNQPANLGGTANKPTAAQDDAMQANADAKTDALAWYQRWQVWAAVALVAGLVVYLRRRRGR